MYYQTLNEPNYNILQSQDIIKILIGDQKREDKEVLENGLAYELGMPYLSGAKIQSIASKFGFVAGLNHSRWIQFKNLIGHCVSSNKIKELLDSLFCESHFCGKWPNISEKDFNILYEKAIDYVLNEINLNIKHSGMRLMYNGSSFVLNPYSKNKIEVPATIIKTSDTYYVYEKALQARDDIQNKKFDSALTKSRTIIEEVLVMMLEKKNLKKEREDAKGDIGKLFKCVQENYNMKTGPGIDTDVNDLINGLNKIVKAIGKIRNSCSDSHGLGSSRGDISEYHAALVVNSSVTICAYLISVMNQSIV